MFSGGFYKTKKKQKQKKQKKTKVTILLTSYIRKFDMKTVIVNIRTVQNAGNVHVQMQFPVHYRQMFYGGFISDC
jgi:ABC-type lipoprotein release transport system permease subunit